MINRKYTKITIDENDSMLNIEFEDKKYEILTTLFFADGSTIIPMIIEKYEEIKLGTIKEWSGTGNVCSVTISRSYSTISDIFDTSVVCTIDTEELIEIINEWNEKMKEFRLNH